MTTSRTSTTFGIALLVAAAMASGGCSLLKGHSEPSTPVLGERIPVLSTERANVIASETINAVKDNASRC